jgi:hypothetical protein
MGGNGLTARLVALAALAGLTLTAYHLFRQPCDPEDTAPARLALFHSNAGTDPTDEYTPVGADNDALSPGDPRYWIAASPGAPPPAAATPGLAPTHITLTASRAENLILNLRDYPAWRIMRNAVSVAPSEYEGRADGLIAIALPVGTNIIDIGYAHTLDQRVGDAVSAIALALLLVTLRRSSRRR